MGRMWDKFGQYVHARIFPIFVVCLFLCGVWYAFAVYLNAPQILDRFEREQTSYTTTDLITSTWAMERPVLPSPHQIFYEIYRGTVLVKPTSKRSLILHGWITLAPTLLGLLIGTTLGMLLAVGIVYVRTLEGSLLPWIIASQTVPILAIAPIIIVVLGSIDLVGVFPKSVIAMYLCFFPVTIGMVKGLRSCEPLHMDLMRTYAASPWQILLKLRLPASMPYLVASMKVAAAAAVVGTIVGELPTGAREGLGARMLVGSYYGQTIQIWAALFLAAALAAVLVVAVEVIGRWLPTSPAKTRA
ncbi:MAG: ABC transporter permease subunit [Pseudomonadota bacterium]